MSYTPPSHGSYPLPVVGAPFATRTAAPSSPMLGPTANGSKGAHYTLIANVPYDTVRQDLVLEFRKFGRVELAMVVCDEASRHPHKEWTSTAGYAFVRFSKRSEAAAAIQAAAMGLISIRGTRVRADWARKDSYAKRGRVSPTQGAPLIGRLGVPDGIEMLQNSLLERQWRQQNGQDTTPSTVSNTPSAVGGYARLASFGEKVLDQQTNTAGGSGEVNQVLIALTRAFSKALADSSTTSPCESSSLDNQPTTAPNTPNNEGQSMSPPRLDIDDARFDVFSQLAELMTSEQQPIGAKFPPANHCAEQLNDGSLVFQDMLSPCSRGLLAVALNDVVGGGSKFCDLSPGVRGTCFSSPDNGNPNSAASPEELLRKAISALPLNEDSTPIMLGETHAQHSPSFFPPRNLNSSRTYHASNPSGSTRSAIIGGTTHADLLCCRTACSSGSEVDESIFSETSRRDGDSGLIRVSSESF